VLFGGFIAFTAMSTPQTNSEVKIIDSIPYASPIKVVRPTYPYAARQAHIEGTVSLRCLIKPDGGIEKIVIQEGQPLLAHSAIEAVSQWRYKPILVNGKAVRGETTVRIVLQLSKGRKQTHAK
jgi:protein TonB